MSFTHSKYRSGFTLIEMMITVLISSIILLGLMRLYLSTTEQTQLSIHVQERALQRQLMLTLFQQSFHNAGFLGCFGHLEQAIQINPDTLPKGIRQNKVPDSDVIVLRQFVPTGHTLKKNLWIVSCHQFERLQVSHEVDQDYPAESLIGNLEKVYWYVRQTPFLKPNGSYVTALSRQEGGAPSEDIVDDVRSMKVSLEKNIIEVRLFWDQEQKSQDLKFALMNPRIPAAQSAGPMGFE